MDLSSLNILFGGITLIYDKELKNVLKSKFSYYFLNKPGNSLLLTDKRILSLTISYKSFFYNISLSVK